MLYNNATLCFFQTLPDVNDSHWSRGVSDDDEEQSPLNPLRRITYSKGKHRSGLTNLHWPIRGTVNKIYSEILSLVEGASLAI